MWKVFWSGKLPADPIGCMCNCHVTLQEQRERGIPVFDLDSFMNCRSTNVSETAPVSNSS